MFGWQVAEFCRAQVAFCNSAGFLQGGLHMASALNEALLNGCLSSSLGALVAV